jgi:hypothetical protein
MASEKQIAANRRNAQKSTGPKTESGKRRASLNAFRHGLASQGLQAVDADLVERGAHQIVADSKSWIGLELARSAAAAELDLAQVRKVRTNLIASDISFGGLAATSYSCPLTEAERSAEVVQRILQLHSTYRYESRAASRRDSAIRNISTFFQNESN